MTLKQHRQHAAQNGHAAPERNEALNARLPKGHPSYGSKNPDKTSKRLARRILKVLESSSLLPELNRRPVTTPDGRPASASRCCYSA